MKSGSTLIAEERLRQVDVEGWTADHDDQEHQIFELSVAARCYAKPLVKAESRCPVEWPWDAVYWKPSDDPIRNRVKAGALIAAEIDRLQRIDS